MKIKSKKAKLSKIADSKDFHNRWESIQRAMTRVLDEAHNTNGTMNEWVDAWAAAKGEIDRLYTLGWSVRHGETKE